MNDNRFGFPRGFLEDARQHLEYLALYPDEWKSELQVDLARRLNVSRNEILLINGITEALEILARHGAGKSVGLLHPSHHPFQKMLDLHSVRQERLPLLRDGEISIPSLKFNVSRVQMVFIDSPNDPLGIDIPRSLIEELLESYQGLVVIDEAGWGFSSRDNLTLVKNFDNVVILRTFSKVFGLAGLKVGYLVANPEVIEQVFERYRCLPGVAPFKQQLAMLAMKHRVNEYINQKVTIVRQEFFKRLDEADINYFPSTTNYVLLEIPSRKALDEIEQELSRHRVFVHPYYNLDGKSYLRITLAPLEALDYVIEAIEVYRYD